MATTNESTDTCPICEVTVTRRVRCSNVSCAFFVTTCPRCDRAQAVSAFVADHEKDCPNRPAVAVPSPRWSFGRTAWQLR